MTVTHQTSYSNHDNTIEGDDIITDDVTGVKELFETYEDALLPIEQQIRRYRKRDLYSSHFHRTSCRILGPRKDIRRVHFNDGDPFSEPTDTNITRDYHTDIKLQLPSYYANNNKVKRVGIKETEEETDSTSDKTWLQERMKLRKGLDNMGLNVGWLRRKPNKTTLEERVLSNLVNKEKNKGDNSESSSTISFDSQQSPFMLCPLYIQPTISRISEYLWNNDLDVDKYFGEEKFINYKQCKEGLDALQRKIAMTNLEIEEILKHFYKNSRRANQMFYKCLRSSLKNFPFSKHTPTTKLKSKIQHHSISEENSLQKHKENRLAEYNEIVKLCEQRGVPLTEHLLRKVLLHPDDLPMTFKPEVKLRQPSEILSKDFWKPKEKKKPRRQTKEQLSPILSPIIKQTSSKNISPPNSNSSFNISNKLSNESLSFKVQDILDFAATTSSDSYDKYSSQASVISDLATPSTSMRQSKKSFFPKLKVQDKSKLKLSHKRRNLEIETSQRLTPEIQIKDEPSLITLPRLRDVMPERHQMNLSTGRAIVTRKVDCWLSFEEYEKITNSIEKEWIRDRPVPNAFWPGHLLNKLRICLPPPIDQKSRSKNTLFQQIQQRKRCNLGYNNNELTWPSDGSYVKYGDVDINKVYHI